jgi:hypothetical protein
MTSNYGLRTAADYCEVRTADDRIADCRQLQS